MVHDTISSLEEGHANIKVDQLAASFEKMTPKKQSFSANCCIFKVPYILRRHNAEAYVPIAFSIGPWHRNKSHLKPTEEIKLNYLNSLVFRSSCSDTMLKQLIKSILEVEEQARDCYSGSIDVSTDEHVKILVLDGCFIIELLRKNDNPELRDSDDPIIKVSSMLHILYHDLILLENQIPWFVLERLFAIMKTESENKPLSTLALRFFHGCISTAPFSETYSFQEQKHILDLVRSWLVQSSEETKLRDEFRWQSIPSATTLVAAGIRIKKAEAKSILNIKFRDGFIEIPRFRMRETTEVIFRNLICYEQCSPGSTDRITSYVIFLDNLIHTVKDMDLLTKNEVIDNWLDPENSVHFLKKLYEDVFVREFYYEDVCQQANIYCRRNWPKLRVIYLSQFTSPWAVVSQIVGGIVLILTFLQTLFGIIK